MRYNLQLLSIMAATLAMLLLTACRPVQPVVELTPAAINAPTLSAEEQAMADASIAFVAAEQTIAQDTLRVRSVEAVDWPDAGLGCPQPDMIYAAVITPGYRVMLESAEAQYTVHTDNRPDGEKILCSEE